MKTIDRPSKYYNQKVNLGDPLSSLTQIYFLVENNSNVLDFGCSSGYLAKVLSRNKKCEVTGLEINKQDSKLARSYCKKVINCDIESYTWEKDLERGSYDVAIFADTLEHLKDPATVLKRVKPLLKNNGYILISIPNIAHASARLELLLGNFDYEKTGIFDDTHLRFFTKKSIINLVEKAVYYVEKIDYSIMPIPGKVINDYLIKVDISYLSGLKKIFNSPEAQAYQYIIKANKKKPKEYKPMADSQLVKPAITADQIFEELNNKFKLETDKIHNSRGWRIISFVHNIRMKIPYLNKL